MREMIFSNYSQAYRIAALWSFVINHRKAHLQCSFSIKLLKLIFAAILNYGFSFLQNVIFVKKEHKGFLIIGEILLVAVHEWRLLHHSHQRYYKKSWSHMIASEWMNGNIPNPNVPNPQQLIVFSIMFWSTRKTICSKSQ